MKNNLPLLHLVCSTDKDRKSLNNILVKGMKFMATNAHVLAVHDAESLSNQSLVQLLIEFEETDTFYIQKEAWKHMCKQDVLLITITKEEVRIDGVVWPNLQVEKETNWLDAIPTEQELKASICLNSKLLLTLNKAINLRPELESELYFHEGNKAVKAIPRINDHNAIGIIMPVKTSF